MRLEIPKTGKLSLLPVSSVDQEAPAEIEASAQEETETRIPIVAKKPVDLVKTSYEQDLVRLMAEVNFIYAEVMVKLIGFGHRSCSSKYL